MRSLLMALSAAIVAAVVLCRDATASLEAAALAIADGPAARAGVAAGARWEGKRAPDFTLYALDGSSIRLADLHGKVVLVNFWATWCAACHAEIPWLAEFERRYQPQGLEILGVSVDDDADAATLTAFARRLHVGYPILLKDAATVSAYGGARFLPQTFLVGRDGRIVNWSYGIRTKDELERTIREALGGRRPTA